MKIWRSKHNGGGAANHSQAFGNNSSDAFSRAADNTLPVAGNSQPVDNSDAFIRGPGQSSFVNQHEFEQAGAANDPPPYTGGAPIVDVSHPRDGVTITTTSTGAVVEQETGHKPYQVDPPTKVAQTTHDPTNPGAFDSPPIAHTDPTTVHDPTNPGAFGSAPKLSPVYMTHPNPTTVHDPANPGAFDPAPKASPATHDPTNPGAFDPAPIQIAHPSHAAIEAMSGGTPSAHTDPTTVHDPSNPGAFVSPTKAPAATTVHDPTNPGAFDPTPKSSPAAHDPTNPGAFVAPTKTPAAKAPAATTVHDPTNPSAFVSPTKAPAAKAPAATTVHDPTNPSAFVAPTKTPVAATAPSAVHDPVNPSAFVAPVTPVAAAPDLTTVHDPVNPSAFVAPPAAAPAPTPDPNVGQAYLYTLPPHGGF